MIYRCQHCLAGLGPVVDGEPAPACPDHPGGGVDLAQETETADGDPQPA